MKILVVCQHYWPEPYPLEDVCEELAKRGHTVHVVTGIPNYPMGYIYPEYRHGRNRRQERNGVTIRRTFTIGRRNNLIFRFLNYFSYPISSALYVCGLKEEYDVVFANQTSPVMMVSAALAYARKHRKKAVLYCMDLWPASVSAGGVKEGSLIYRLFDRISDFLYRRADKILVTSRMFTSYFEEQFGIRGETVEYLPQYADSRFETLPPWEADGLINLVFAGNVGAAQSLDTVLQAAELLRTEENLRWHIVGDGSELERLKAKAAQMQLEQVVFHGRRPMEEMPAYYAMADAMLVTLTSDPVISMTLPGKVQTYMAAGKPVLAAANGEIPEVIRSSGCGFCAEAEDARGLADAVRAFLNCEDKAALGRNARTYYENHYTRDLFMDHLERVLKEHCTGDEGTVH